MKRNSLGSLVHMSSDAEGAVFFVRYALADKGCLASFPADPGSESGDIRDQQGRTIDLLSTDPVKHEKKTGSARSDR